MVAAPERQPAVCPWVKRFADRIPDGEVLDLACGGGRNGRYLLSLGYRVVFLDRDISRVQDLDDHPAATILCFDLEQGGEWPFAPERFMGIVVVNYLHRPLFRSLNRALKPGGVLLYQTFAEGHQRFGRPRNPNFLLRDQELLEVFQVGMEVVEFEQGYQPDPPAVKQSLYAVRKV